MQVHTYAESAEISMRLYNVESSCSRIIPALLSDANLYRININIIVKRFVKSKRSFIFADLTVLSFILFSKNNNDDARYSTMFLISVP